MAGLRPCPHQEFPPPPTQRPTASGIGRPSQLPRQTRLDRPATLARSCDAPTEPHVSALLATSTQFGHDDSFRPRRSLDSRAPPAELFPPAAVKRKQLQQRPAPELFRLFGERLTSATKQAVPDGGHLLCVAGNPGTLTSRRFAGSAQPCERSGACSFASQQARTFVGAAVNADAQICAAAGEEQHSAPPTRRLLVRARTTVLIARATLLHPPSVSEVDAIGRAPARDRASSNAVAPPS